MNEAHSGGSISASGGPPARVIRRLGIPNYRVGGALRCRSRGARVKPGCMCAEKRLGRARLRLRMSLSGFRLCHSPRGGCAARKTEAVAGDPPFSMPGVASGRVGMCTPSHLPRGSLRISKQSLAGRPIGEPGRAGRGLSPWLAARVGGTARLGRGTVLTPLRGGPDKCVFRSGRCGYYFAREGRGDLQCRVRTPSAQTGGGSIP